MTYCFVTRIGLKESLSYINAESEDEAIRQLELDYAPIVLDYYKLIEICGQQEIITEV